MLHEDVDHVVYLCDQERACFWVLRLIRDPSGKDLWHVIECRLESDGTQVAQHGATFPHRMDAEWRFCKTFAEHFDSGARVGVHRFIVKPNYGMSPLTSPGNRCILGG